MLCALLLCCGVSHCVAGFFSQPLQVLEKVEVWETIEQEGKGHRFRQYKLKLTFLPHKIYEVVSAVTISQLLSLSLSLISQSLYVVTPAQVLQYVEQCFVRRLVSAVNRQVKLLREKR